MIFVSQEDMTYMAIFCYDSSKCSRIARLFNDVGKFSICVYRINLSYFPSRARLNFGWIFKEFDLESNMKGFFKNSLALSVT